MNYVILWIKADSITCAAQRRRICSGLKKVFSDGPSGTRGRSQSTGFPLYLATSSENWKK